MGNNEVIICLPAAVEMRCQDSSDDSRLAESKIVCGHNFLPTLANTTRSRTTLIPLITLLQGRSSPAPEQFLSLATITRFTTLKIIRLTARDTFSLQG